jgi:hypothetical protein
MATPNIRIRVGASLDRDAQAVLTPLIQAVAKAKAKIEADAKGINKIFKTEVQRGIKDSEIATKQAAAALAGPYRTSARQAAAETKKTGDEAKKAGAVIGNVAEGAADKFKLLAASAKTLTPTLQAVSREAQKELAKIERASARAALGLPAGGGGGGPKDTTRFGRRVGYWSMRNFAPVTPTLAMGGRIAGDIARGAGVDLNAGSYVSDFVKRQSMASQLANAGYMAPKKGQPITANNMRQDPHALMSNAAEAGSAAGMDPTQALEGLQKFVAKTGDLATGRDILTDMAKTAKATGANLDDTVDAAGDVANALGDVPNKGERIKAIMLAIAGQGKIGAVEIKDLAKQMAKVSASAGQFSGDAGQNVGIMGGLAQMTRARGGAASATSAATSLLSFTNTFSKSARRSAFAAEGIQINGKDGKIRNPEEIILESLQKTKGDTNRMGKLFADAQARRVTRGFETVYKEHGGGQAGLVAVKKAFDDMRGATMTLEERNQSLANRMQDTDTKVQLFKNKLQATTDTTMERLLPALERLGPIVEHSASAFGNFLLWATDNPGKAVAAALGAAISKAAVENTIRSGIERMFTAGAGGKTGGALGALGSAGVIAALAVTAVTIGVAYIDSFYAKKAAEQKKDIATQIETRNLTSKALIQKEMTPEEQKTLEAKLVELKAQKAKAKANLQQGGGVDDQIFHFLAQKSVLGFSKSVQGLDKSNQEALRQSYEMVAQETMRTNAILEQVRDGIIKIVPRPTADPSGRSDPNAKSGNQ